MHYTEEPLHHPVAIKGLLSCHSSSIPVEVRLVGFPSCCHGVSVFWGGAYYVAFDYRIGENGVSSSVDGHKGRKNNLL